jgi:hypothetical protein
VGKIFKEISSLALPNLEHRGRLSTLCHDQVPS